MYLTKNEKIIQKQKKLIDRLIEENKCLKEQVIKYESYQLNEQIKDSDEQLNKLNDMITELQECKKEYLRLNRKLTTEINKMQRNGDVIGNTIKQ